MTWRFAPADTPPDPVLDRHAVREALNRGSRDEAMSAYLDVARADQHPRRQTRALRSAAALLYTNPNLHPGDTIRARQAAAPRSHRATLDLVTHARDTLAHPAAEPAPVRPRTVRRARDLPATGRVRVRKGSTPHRKAMSTANKKQQAADASYEQLMRSMRDRVDPATVATRIAAHYAVHGDTGGGKK